MTDQIKFSIVHKYSGLTIGSAFIDQGHERNADHPSNLEFHRVVMEEEDISDNIGDPCNSAYDDIVRNDLYLSDTDSEIETETDLNSTNISGIMELDEVVSNLVEIPLDVMDTLSIREVMDEIDYLDEDLPKLTARTVLNNNGQSKGHLTQYSDDINSEDSDWSINSYRSFAIPVPDEPKKVRCKLCLETGNDIATSRKNFSRHIQKHHNKTLNNVTKCWVDVENIGINQMNNNLNENHDIVHVHRYESPTCKLEENFDKLMILSTENPAKVKCLLCYTLGDDGTILRKSFIGHIRSCHLQNGIVKIKKKFFDLTGFRTVLDTNPRRVHCILCDKEVCRKNFSAHVGKFHSQHVSDFIEKCRSEHLADFKAPVANDQENVQCLLCSSVGDNQLVADNRFLDHLMIH